MHRRQVKNLLAFRPTYATLGNKYALERTTALLSLRLGELKDYVIIPKLMRKKRPYFAELVGMCVVYHFLPGDAMGYISDQCYLSSICNVA